MPGRVVLIVGMLLGMAVQAAAVEVRVGVLRVDYPVQAPISRYDLRPDDLGMAGATLGEEDNQTTGRFLGMTFAATHVATPPEGADAALAQMLADGLRLIVVLAQAGDVLRLADAAPDALLINAQASETGLRSADCRANLLHVVPSHAMKADAVVQFALWKKWSDAVLIHGSNPADRALAEAYRAAARKFGMRLREEREFEDTGGSRRTDTGHVLVQRQLPVFMQDLARHDVVLAADDSDVFAPYLPYHLWDPRPVMGSAGLRPVSFHAAHEAWGATQFQRRFERLTGRYVRDEDYNAWLAQRVIGEAAIRTLSGDADTLRSYILSDGFELAAFKGQPVTFRTWNGQLRQPILLHDGRITVSVSPQDGFLHQNSPLDSLGLDQPESACTAFAD